MHKTHEIPSIKLYTLNKNTLIKLPDRKKTANYYRVIGHVWVLFHQSAHTRLMYPVHFAGNSYTSRNTATTTPI